MNASFFRPLSIFTLLLVVTQSLFARPVPSDTLPSGTKINLQILLPGESTATSIQYVIPAPVLPVVSVPVVTTPVVVAPVVVVGPLADGFVIGTRAGHNLVARLFNSKYYITEQLGDGTFLIRGTNLLAESSVNTTYTSKRSLFAGGETAYGGLVQPADFVTPIGYTQKKFSDGAVYYAPSSTISLPPAGNSVNTPTVPDQGNSSASVSLGRPAVNFAYTPQPNRINRLQTPTVPAYQDNWKMKQSELIPYGNGDFTETPDQLKARGVNWFHTNWFYGGDGPAAWGYPKATDNLFYEYTGSYWAPYYQSAYRSLVDDMSTIGNNCMFRLAGWNSVPENGLIDGVPTVKEGHFNLEYSWIEMGGGPAESNWNDFSPEMKNTRFFNYAINQYETLQQCYDRGQIPALRDALFQKWRNIIGLSVLYLNRHNNGMRAYYGDYWGLSHYHDLANWSAALSPAAMLTANVDNAGWFPEANESCNAGTVTLNNGDSFDVSGNFNQLQGRRNCYNYEWNVSMKWADFNAFFAVTKDSPSELKNINLWYDKLIPDRIRPYNMAYHALLERSIIKRKGWTDFYEYWQKETIYEHNINVIDYPGEPYKEAAGAWVPWTLNDSDPMNRATKIPLHPEVTKNLMYLSRMHYDGEFAWGSTVRLNPDQMKGENLNANVHAVSREAEALALAEVDSYNDKVFLADKRQHLDDVPVLNTTTGQYVTGGPHILLNANNNISNPVPLVTAVDSPSSGWELYAVYYPHATRDGQTLVSWKSPVDGTKLVGYANGWGVTLYARKR